MAKEAIDEDLGIMYSPRRVRARTKSYSLVDKASTTGPQRKSERTSRATIRFVRLAFPSKSLPLRAKVLATNA